MGRKGAVNTGRQVPHGTAARQTPPVRHGTTHLALLEDHLDLVVREGVLEAVTEEDDKGQALPKLVRAGRRARGVATGQFVLEFAGEDERQG